MKEDIFSKDAGKEPRETIASLLLTRGFQLNLYLKCFSENNKICEMRLVILKPPGCAANIEIWSCFGNKFSQEEQCGLKFVSFQQNSSGMNPHCTAPCGQVSSVIVSRPIKAVWVGLMETEKNPLCVCDCFPSPSLDNSCWCVYIHTT